VPGRRARVIHAMRARLRRAAGWVKRVHLVVRSQVWLKETDDKWQPGEVIKVKEENLQESEEDRKRVAERNKKNAEIFSPETMEEDIKRLRVHLALYITGTRLCMLPVAICAAAPRVDSWRTMHAATQIAIPPLPHPLLLCGAG